MMPAEEALELLRAGNRRFTAGIRDIECAFDSGYQASLLDHPRPVAAILGCSDSRVQSEMLFQQCCGHLFVTRVAGAIAGPSQIGSIEYAVEALGVRLVVVLGHSDCGAVTQALDPSAAGSEHLGSILAELRAALPAAEMRGRDVDRAVRASVRATCARLHKESSVLREGVQSGDLKIVGAHYCIGTGAVDFDAGVDGPSTSSASRLGSGPGPESGVGQP